MISVLYVEDELNLAKIVKETLESRSFDVVHVADGAEVLTYFQKHTFDVIILDVMLPNKNGFEIAAEIREANRSIPILFLTAKEQTEDVIRGFSIGGNDYIRKPFSMEELIARINNLVSLRNLASEKFNQKKYAFRSIEFLPNLQQLISKSGVIQLSHRESEILTYLVNGKGGISKRKEMLNQIWGDDSISNSRNLDVYITKLRSYIKDESSVQIITLKGVGYRFVVDL